MRTIKEAVQELKEARAQLAKTSKQKEVQRRAAKLLRITEAQYQLRIFLEELERVSLPVEEITIEAGEVSSGSGYGYVFRLLYQDVSILYEGRSAIFRIADDTGKAQLGYGSWKINDSGGYYHSFDTLVKACEFVLRMERKSE